MIKFDYEENFIFMSKNPKQPANSNAKLDLKFKLDYTHILAALSYIWALCLVTLLIAPKNDYVRFHAKQGLILFAAEILSVLIFWVPIVGQALFIVFVIVSLIGIYKALQGEKWKMPIAHKYSQRI